MPIIAIKSAPPPPSPARPNDPPPIYDPVQPLNLTSKEQIKPEQLFINSNPAWKKVYPHPSLPQDVLITLAVINIDPDNQNGVACREIIAFLSLYFPYFNRNLEDCRKLVRMAHNIKPEQETGNENFRIKSALIPRLMDRMDLHMRKNRLVVFSMWIHVKVI